MRPSRRAGYTLIEIMISVVIMTIGAAGILAMQGAAVHSNQDAGETSVAINFATSWMERVKRDARRWITIGQASLANTSYLNNVTTNAGVWIVPAATMPESPGADYFGFETNVAANIRYCVNLRFTQAHLIGANLDAVRVDVMVWWKRHVDQTTTTAVCATALSNTDVAGTSNVNILRKHFLSSLVTWRDPTQVFP